MTIDFKYLQWGTCTGMLPGMLPPQVAHEVRVSLVVFVLMTMLATSSGSAHTTYAGDAHDLQDPGNNYDIHQAYLNQRDRFNAFWNTDGYRHISQDNSWHSFVMSNLASSGLNLFFHSGHGDADAISGWFCTSGPISDPRCPDKVSSGHISFLQGRGNWRGSVFPGTVVMIMASRSAQAPERHLANAFMLGGTWAYVGWHNSPYPAAAREFAYGFWYELTVNARTIDAAFAKARDYVGTLNAWANWIKGASEVLVSAYTESDRAAESYPAYTAYNSLHYLPHEKVLEPSSPAVTWSVDPSFANDDGGFVYVKGQIPSGSSSATVYVRFSSNDGRGTITRTYSYVLTNYLDSRNEGHGAPAMVVRARDDWIGGGALSTVSVWVTSGRFALEHAELVILRE